MTPPASALYVGRVTHRRVKPRRHALGYRVFNLLVDLDEADGLARRLRFFSRNRFNLLSLHDRDHGDGSGRPLRPQVEAMLRRAGIAAEGGAIRLLCMPRVLGHVFNPLSVYFCHATDGRLAGIVYEVSNTFGERHSYVVPVEPSEEAGWVRQSAPKRFYVSPFLEMDMTYDFAVRPPAEAVTVAVTASDAAGPVIATAFKAERREMTDGALLKAVASHPLLTLKVLAAIHWEALRIWLKGVRLQPRAPAPREPATAVPVASSPNPR